LIRPSPEQIPEERLRVRMARSGYDGDIAPNVRVLPGNILRPGWDMAPEDLEEVRRDVDIIIHNAADTSFANKSDPGKTNVEGVRRLVELARSCDRTPLIVYMSTASNVGEVAGRCVTEDEGCRPDHRHFNEYTHSKAIAEALLRESGLPVLTLRPTIVLSAGLPDPQFARQILWFVPITRLFEALPLNPTARLDVVDVGFVAEATLRLLALSGRRHDCYHLSAGPGRSICLAEFIPMVDRLYRRRTPVHLIPPSQWSRSTYRTYIQSRMQRVMFSSLRYYVPFLNMNVVYDDSRLREDLGADTPELRPTSDYLCELLRLIKTSTAIREAALP
jgi:nucleoside-diphosphate-sugar epimerase